MEASELLSIYPAVRVFAEEALGESHALRGELQSFFALCHVCDLLKRARSGEQPVQELREAVSHYLRSFVACYGKTTVRFKHHQLIHIPSQLERDGLLLSCWTAERKNKTLLKGIKHNAQAQTMAPGVLARAAHMQVCTLSIFLSSDLLVHIL